MDAWDVVDTLFLILATIIIGGFGWLVNYVVSSRRRTSEVETQLAVLETRIIGFDAVTQQLQTHTDSCTKTNNELRADVNDVKTQQAVTNALLQEVKSGQQDIFRILDEIRK